jgi:hypothetical protein
VPNLIPGSNIPGFPEQRNLIVNASSVNNIQASSAFNVGFIPTATLTYKNLFITGSYMATTDYQFGTSSQTVTAPIVVFTDEGSFIDPDLPFGLKTDLEASRQEWDFTMGYFPLEWLGIAMGYKGIVQDYKLKQTLTAPFGIDFVSPETGVTGTLSTTSSSKIRYNGPILGVLANTRLSDNFALLGNVFGGYLFVDCTPSCTQTVWTHNVQNLQSTADFTLGSQSLVEDSPFVSTKLMLRYAPTSLPALSLTLSYRVQLIISESDISSGPGIDVTHGPVVGVNYRF